MEDLAGNTGEYIAQVSRILKGEVTGDLVYLPHRTATPYGWTSGSVEVQLALNRSGASMI